MMTNVFLGLDRRWTTDKTLRLNNVEVQDNVDNEAAEMRQPRLPASQNNFKTEVSDV